MSIRMRHTSGHTRNRRSHHALKNTNVIIDKENGNLRLPHHLDEATGMYRGKQIFTPKKKDARVKTPKGTHHEHVSEETITAKQKGSKGIVGKPIVGAKPKARSGFGGGV